MSGIAIETIDDKTTRFTFNNRSVAVLIRHGDLSEEHCDAIVNSTNAHMKPSGGVDELIHKKMGGFYTKQVNSIAKAMNVDSCPVGQSRIFPARIEVVNNDVPYVINTVGPVYEEAEKTRAAFLLKSCYFTSFTLANLYGLASVAYPAISCGAHGYPPTEAARVAIESVREFANNVKDVRFVLYDRLIYENFVEVWTSYAQEVTSAANDAQPEVLSIVSSTPTGSGRYCVLCTNVELPYNRQLQCAACAAAPRSEVFTIFLAKLRVAAENSFSDLADQCQLLRPLLKFYPLAYNPVQNFDVTIHKRDAVAEEYHEQYCTREFRSSKPVAVVGDGNCFYNSFVRLVEAGSPTSTPSLTATELRARNIVELVLNVDRYRDQYGHLSALLRGFKQYVKQDMVRDSITISAWDFVSIATVLNISLITVYPMVNGVDDRNFLYLNNALFIPLVSEDADQDGKGGSSAATHEVKLLFSCSDLPNSDPKDAHSRWTPNHVVPLLDLTMS